MPLELLNAAFGSLAGIGAQAHVTAYSAPAILALILAVHGAYFVRNRGLSGQQEIRLQDLTDLGAPSCTGADGLTVVRAALQEFDATTRSACEAVLPLPSCAAAGTLAGARRFRDAETLEDAEIHQVLICSDDLHLRGRTVFSGALKVAGDLSVEGEAIFLAPVVVSGVLKVSGSAHFAEGVIAKGDAMVVGSMAIGSDSGQGWGVVGELALGERLTLNGTLVASRAVQLKRAA